MSFFELSVISVALGLDAFGVALSLGFDKRINKKIAIFFILSFSFFQFFFVFIGGFGGDLFNRYICILPNFVGGFILIFVGLLMIKEGFSDQNKIEKIHWFLIIILGVGVSIDALVVGFSTFDIFYLKTILLENALVVGVITAFMTLLAFAISRYIRRIIFFRRYADFLAGIILILFGIHMIFF